MIRRRTTVLVFLLCLAAVSVWAQDKPAAVSGGEKKTGTTAASAATPAAASATAPSTPSPTGNQKAPADTAAADKGPVKVEVGTYVNQILSLDLKGNQFNVDFYIWFRWKGDAVKPFDTFELANGRILSRTGIVKKDLAGGVHYASARLLANVTKFWDLRRYPLDDHQLTLEIEDNENEDNLLVYVPDAQNSNASPTVEVPGWAVAGTTVSVTSHQYATNYGDSSVPTGNASSYSRLVSAVKIVRPAHARRFSKVFFTLFVSTIISWLAFWVKPKETGPRISLCVGSLFAAAAATFAINNMLPDTNSTTMADRLVVVSMTMIFGTCVETILAVNLGYAGKENLQRLLDRSSAWVFPVLYLLMMLTYVL
jgi:hypothetical protein